MKDANRMLKLDLEKELVTELRGLRVSALAIVCSNPAVSFESLNLLTSFGSQMVMGRFKNVQQIN